MYGVSSVPEWEFTSQTWRNCIQAWKWWNQGKSYAKVCLTFWECQKGWSGQFGGCKGSEGFSKFDQRAGSFLQDCRSCHITAGSLLHSSYRHIHKTASGDHRLEARQTFTKKINWRASGDENLPQYNEAWGDKDNKEKASTRYMAAIVWFFMKREMCGTAGANYRGSSRLRSSRVGQVDMYQSKEEQQWKVKLLEVRQGGRKVKTSRKMY